MFVIYNLFRVKKNGLYNYWLTYHKPNITSNKFNEKH